jgi:hypothetical protein
MMGLYADDGVLLTRSTKAEQMLRYLQPATENYTRWLADWRIAINADKTAATLFTRRRPPTPHSLQVKGRDILWSPSSKYLGVTLDSKLTWELHTANIAAKATQKIAALYPLLKNKNLPIDKKMRLYNGGIKPIMTYASSVWSGCKSRFIKKLQKVQNKAFKVCTNLPRYTRKLPLHRDLDQQILAYHLKNIAVKFYDDLEHNPNQAISVLSNIAVNSWDKYPRPISAVIKNI